MAIKVGVLGFAHGHVFAYLAQWRDRPKLDIAAVAGWDHAAARLQAQSEANGLKAFTEVSDLLAEVDAVVISSETSLHAGLVEQAAAAGKAIIVQKPIALTLEDAREIVGPNCQVQCISFKIAKGSPAPPRINLGDPAAQHQQFAWIPALPPMIVDCPCLLLDQMNIVYYEKDIGIGSGSHDLQNAPHDEARSIY